MLANMVPVYCVSLFIRQQFADFKTLFTERTAIKMPTNISKSATQQNTGSLRRSWHKMLKKMTKMPIPNWKWW